GAATIRARSRSPYRGIAVDPERAAAAFERPVGRPVMASDRFLIEPRHQDVVVLGLPRGIVDIVRVPEPVVAPPHAGAIGLDLIDLEPPVARRLDVTRVPVVPETRLESGGALCFQEACLERELQ